MKLKNLAVITLLALACSFASAQSFGFGSAVYGYLYCNFEQLTNNYEVTGAWGVTDNLSACGIGYNGTGGGFNADAKNFGLPVYGQGVIYGDNIYDAESQYYTGYQWTVFTDLKCARINKRTGYPEGRYGWIGIASYSEFVFGDNYGWLMCALPSAHDGSKARGTSAGPVGQFKKR
ncbi:MAG: hypothetical protein ABSG07_19035 [Terriglobales bacterium]|jgi:hypothetical protein